MASQQHPSPPLADLLASGRLTPEALARARASADEVGEAMEIAATRLGLVPEGEMAEAFARSLGLPRVGADALAGVAALPAPANPRFLRQFRVLPFAALDGGALGLAMANPMDDYAANAIALLSDMPVARHVATPSDLDAALDRLLPAEPGQAAGDDAGAAGGSRDLERLRDLASDAPVVRLVHGLIARAVDQRASDVHLEPHADRLVVRYRVDGALREAASHPPALRDALVSRVKVLAGLDLAERRLPQDGRLSMSVRGAEVDFRVATVPTAHGEGAVVRVLDRARVSLDFAALGFDERALAAWRPVLGLPNGIVLVTGPTGSGKTTTLYASLAALSTAERKVVTVEDPVEYRMEGVTQDQAASPLDAFS